MVTLAASAGDTVSASAGDSGTVGASARRSVKVVAGRAAAFAGLGLAVLGVAVLGVASPASAGVKVDAENVGTAGATISFTADGGSTTAGIDGLRTFLPKGMSPRGVSLASGPPGWKLVRTADGFTVSGKALEPGKDARYSVIIQQMPQGVQRFWMRTVQHYSDGKTEKFVATDVQDATAPGAAPILDLNPSPPPPIQTVQEPAPNFIARVPTNTWMIGGGMAAALIAGAFWYRSRMAY